MDGYSIGSEYRSDEAYFIAGGKTLEIIEQYEEDCANYEALEQQLIADYGATWYVAGLDRLYFSEETEHPALKFVEETSDDNIKYAYSANLDTPEGVALQERMDDTPGNISRISFRMFHRRLTGSDEPLKRSPDGIELPHDVTLGNFRRGCSDWLYYRQYGDLYVVSCPISIRGIFQEAASAEQALPDDWEPGMTVGHRYEWFVPEDSEQIPFSRLVALQEAERGDQMKMHTVTYSDDLPLHHYMRPS